jgi:hypothetical protein
VVGVEGCDYFVAGLEAGYAGADGFDCACAVGAGDDVFFDGEGVCALVEGPLVYCYGGASVWSYPGDG